MLISPYHKHIFTNKMLCFCHCYNHEKIRDWTIWLFQFTNEKKKKNNKLIYKGTEREHSIIMYQITPTNEKWR